MTHSFLPAPSTVRPKTSRRFWLTLAYLGATAPVIPLAHATPRAVFEASKPTQECSTGYETKIEIGELRNEGDSDLVISGLTLTGRDAINFSFEQYNPHDPTAVFHPVTLSPGETFIADLNPNCRAFGKVGTLNAQVTLTTNDPDKTALTIPFAVVANNRPNIQIDSLRESIVRVNGMKLLRFSFRIGNTSASPTKTRPEVGIELAGKTRLFSTPRILKSLEAHRFRVLIPHIPQGANQVSLGGGIPDPDNAPLASGAVRVDPRNRIHEGNENRKGSLYDNDSSELEFGVFYLFAR